ncbi:ABC transporter substrate-binding protein [Provencibacterium massiliense]|uniref:ABC transporter substrate-binding protein n=1 Tax=Provencibacterium massiliense TaxID=1841868 RepID=UPI0009A74491|nr:extracellular solute-binding protein [Provencibacterium massiliense]RGB67911.1 extracellular solute-binding protein [Harryflintia acetispora]
MKKSIRLWSALLGLLLTLSAAGCGAGQQESAGSSLSSGEAKSQTSEPADQSEGETIKITIMDYGDSYKPQRDAANEAYMKEHPNLEIEYTLTTRAQLTNTILSAVSSGTAPDLFAIPDGITPAQAVSEGWYLPMSDYMENEQEVWDSFVDGAITEGKCMFDGKVYMVPESGGAPHCMVLYNKDLFAAAGLDPEVPPKTYSEFREYARRITEAGNGQFYGIVEGATQSDRMAQILVCWSDLIGGSYRVDNNLNIRTGTPDWNNEAVYQVCELWKNLCEDESLHPNTATYIAPDARAAFAGGQAGMIVQGWWNVGVWEAENPELNYGVFAPPVPDGGSYTGCIPRMTGDPFLGVYSGTKHPQEAVDYLINVICGKDFQSAAVAAGVHDSLLRDVSTEASVFEASKEYFALGNELGRVIPEFEVANPDTAIVVSKFQEVHPNPTEIFSGILSGQVTDYKTALAQYTEAATEMWDKALADANAEGHSFTTADFAFPDWDPTRNFTVEDYAALKK